MTSVVQDAIRAVRGAGRPTASPHTADGWPIVASMGHAQPVSGSGVGVREAGPRQWGAELDAVAALRFDRVELSDAWLPLWRLDEGELSDLRGAAERAGLDVTAVLAARCSVAERGRREANVGRIHATIDAAARLGAGIVGLGFHEPLTAAQRDALWFWTQPDAQSPDDPQTRRRAVGDLRELADHAADDAMQLSLELYPNAYLGTADGAVELVEIIDRPNVGLNPDLGNLFRVQGEVEAWEYVAARTLPLANYWHVKNYFRLEDGQGGALTSPAPLADGAIDYRQAVAYAIAHGFGAPILVEHYGGDSLTTIARSRDYLRSILPAGC